MPKAPTIYTDVDAALAALNDDSRDALSDYELTAALKLLIAHILERLEALEASP